MWRWLQDHPSQSLWTPWSKDSHTQNMKPLSTHPKGKTTLSTFEVQEHHNASWQAQNLPGLVSCIALQPPIAFFGRHLLQYVISFARSNLIGAPVADRGTSNILSNSWEVFAKPQKTLNLEVIVNTSPESDAAIHNTQTAGTCVMGYLD